MVETIAYPKDGNFVRVTKPYRSIPDALRDVLRELLPELFREPRGQPLREPNPIKDIEFKKGKDSSDSLLDQIR